MAAPLGGSVSILSHQSVFPMEGSNIYFSRFDSISNSSQNYLSVARSKASLRRRGRPLAAARARHAMRAPREAAAPTRVVNEGTRAAFAAPSTNINLHLIPATLTVNRERKKYCVNNEKRDPLHVMKSKTLTK